MSLSPPNPYIATPIAKTIAVLSNKIKDLAQSSDSKVRDEMAVLKLLLAYHKSLRPRGCLRKSIPFDLEKANPFSCYSPDELLGFQVAMQTLFSLNPFHRRRLRYSECPILECPPERFSSYSAAYAQLPFINFTALCLFSHEYGSFYFYPTFILHYAPSAPLHQPIFLSLREEAIGCSVFKAHQPYETQSDAVVNIYVVGLRLTLQFDFSPLVITAFSLLQSHSMALDLPLSSHKILFTQESASPKIFQLINLLHNGIFSINTLSDNLQETLYDTALLLSEAYHIQLYSIDQFGTPTFSPRPYIDYLRRAILHIRINSEQHESCSLFEQLSSEYFTASLFYVRRLFQLVNADFTLYNTQDNCAEGIIRDLLRIAFSINGYSPRRELVSLPVMQALFLTFLPNVPLSLRSFKVAYRKWPFAIDSAISIFKREDYLQQFCDSEFLSIKFAAQASPNEAADAVIVLRNIAELMFSCCELKTQKKSFKYFRLKAQFETAPLAARSRSAQQPVLFELAKLADPLSFKSLFSSHINLPNNIDEIIHHALEKLPMLIFIHARYRGTIPFIIYETALRQARLSGKAFCLTHCSINLNRIDLKTLAASIKQAANGVLAINVLPIGNNLEMVNLADTKEKIAALFAIKRPKVIFVTFIGMQPEKLFVASEIAKTIFFHPTLIYQHGARMQNFAYIFRRLAVCFQVSVTREAIQTLVLRLRKSQSSQTILYSHSVPVILSFFRQALLAHAKRQADCLQNPRIDSSNAITADDILSIKFNTSSF